MLFDSIYDRALRRLPLSEEEAILLYLHAPTEELCLIADTIRRQVKGDTGIVTWQIDRNINITNACVSGCKFCNFHCKPHQKEQIFITTIDQYSEKIEELIALGGDQILLQGGLHPDLDIAFYEHLFKELKSRYPNIKLHALGPPEIFHIARISNLSIEKTLERLLIAGLDSLPGAGAEILDSAIRKRISPGKCSAEEWIDVMRIAHRMGLSTSATMMYGHVEQKSDRIRHLLRIASLQAECPAGNPGFVAFIPWIFCAEGTRLQQEGVHPSTSDLDYLRTIAISRIVLYNIDNIQASWLTVGRKTGQLALHAGANDMGSIMIEEHVVSSAGAHYRMDREGMERTIREAGFTPQLRDQRYEPREPINTDPTPAQ